MPKYVADGTKQVPGALPDNAYDKSVIPNTGSFQKPPNSVVFGDVGGDISFWFGSSASFAKLVVAEDGANAKLYTGSQYVNFGTPAAGTSLNISPSAYSSSAAGDGKVIFVYKSGLGSGGA